MRQVRIQIGGPGQGPGRPPGILARILVGIMAAVVLVSAALLGAIFFLAALAFFVVASVIVGVRLWWLRRKIERAMREGRPPEGFRDAGASGARRADVIEGEYVVVEEGRDEKRRGAEEDEEEHRGA